MPYYSNDGKHKITVKFNKQEVENYYTLFNVPSNNEVPILLCAKLWPKLSLFNEIKKGAIFLKNTEIKQKVPLKIDEEYEVDLILIDCKKIKYWTRYMMRLDIRLGLELYASITQVFVKKRM